MSVNTECLTLDELERLTGIKPNDLTVQLHYLHEKGLIVRKWKKCNGTKKRLYCLKKDLIIRNT